MNNPDGYEKPMDAYGEHIPPHECTGHETCPHPPGFFMMMVRNTEDPDENAYLQMSGIHNVTPDRIVQAMVHIIDMAFQDNRGDTPVMIAYAKGRALLREVTEQLPPPGDVLASANDYMANLDWDLS